MTKIRDEKYLKNLGNRIKEIRLKKDISVNRLSVDAGVSRSQIHSIEKGELNPTICTLKVIAEAMEVEIKDLLLF